ncbi:phosphoribosyltransferase [Halomicrobium salinisoli]|uniref:phosphoribosyltransferase n=1 Tax=Halomicrobium salinisoli TaxID=2878391 RepID=UPI001CF07ADF|nr:phosphoribosyltransferase family protein [Halomicrobium salinisoli]
MPFSNRTDAGRQLAALLDREDVDADVVLGIPRGGLPVARPVADRLGAPLDIVVASKIGAPRNPELAIGAAAADGSAWLNHDLIERLGVARNYVERQRQREARAAAQKAQHYRGERAPPALAGRRVVVVDDGIATGATARACLRQVRAAGAARVVLAVPVGSPRTVEELQAEGQEVVAVETPPHFRAVGQFYRQFGQVSDAEAMTYLDGVRRGRA